MQRWTGVLGVLLGVMLAEMALGQTGAESQRAATLPGLEGVSKLTFKAAALKAPVSITQRFLVPARPSPFIYSDDVLVDARTGAQAGQGRDAHIVFSALSHDGQYAAGDGTGGVQVWSFKEKKVVQKFEDNLRLIEFVSPTVLAFERAGANNIGTTLVLRDVVTGAAIKELPVKTGGMKWMVSPDGNLLITTERKGITVFNTNPLEVVGEFDLNSERGDPTVGGMVGGAISYDGKELATAWRASHGRVCLIVILDTHTGAERARLRVNNYDFSSKVLGFPQYLRYFPSGEKLLLTQDSIIDRQTGRSIYGLPGHRNVFDNFTIVANEDTIVTLAMIEADIGKRILRTLDLPREQLAKATSIVRNGGDPEDAVLPAAMTLDPCSAAAALVLEAKPKAGAAPAQKPRSGKFSPINMRLGLVDGTAVSGPEAGILAVARRGANEGTRLVETYDVDTGSKKGECQVSGGYLTDLSTNGKVMLLGSTRQRSWRYDVWSLEQTPRYLGRFILGKLPSFEYADGAAAIVGANDHLLLRGNGQTSLVRIADGKIVGQSVAGQLMDVRPTPDRSQLAVATAEGVGLVDISTLKTVSFVARPNKKSSGIVVSPGGNLLLYFDEDTSGRRLVLVDLAAGKVRAEANAASVGYFSAWLGEEWLLTDSGMILSTRDLQPVWQYQTPSRAMLLGMIMDHMQAAGRLWHVRDFDVASRILRLEVPDAAMKEGIAAAAGKDVWAVKPGDTVAISINVPEAPEGGKKLEAAIAARLAEAGLKSGPSAIVVKASGKELDHGQPVTFAPDGGTITVPRNDVEVSLSIECSGQEMWGARMPIPSSVAVPVLRGLRPEMTDREKLALYGPAWRSEQWERGYAWLVGSAKGIPGQVVDVNKIGKSTLAFPGVATETAPKVTPTAVRGGEPKPVKVATTRSVTNATPAQEKAELKTLKQIENLLKVLRTSADEMSRGLADKSIAKAVFTDRLTKIEAAAGNLPVVRADELPTETAESIKALKTGAVELGKLYRAAATSNQPDAVQKAATLCEDVVVPETDFLAARLKTLGEKGK